MKIRRICFGGNLADDYYFAGNRLLMFDELPAELQQALAFATAADEARRMGNLEAVKSRKRLEARAATILKQALARAEKRRRRLQ